MNKSREIFISGGCSFVGSTVSRIALADGYHVRSYDVLDPKTVNPQTVAELVANPNFELIQGDLLDYNHLVSSIGSPDIVIHSAAISSVDRSIKNPRETILINSVGTVNILEAARQNNVKRVHLVSTDEVFGHATKGHFTEKSHNRPRNPYAAGKLAAEAITMVYKTTFNLETTITNSANNYGAYQSPDKLIPRLTVRALTGNTLPVYGSGRQVREWVSVNDHARAILFVAEKGQSGEKYCVGSGETRRNIFIVRTIISELGINPNRIVSVPDRPGHDLRYSLDTSKIKDLGWTPSTNFEEGLVETIKWYRDNQNWWAYYLSIYKDLLPEDSVAIEKIPIAT